MRADTKGAGAVGLFAVQLAHLNGAYVIATSSAANLEFVKQLGADDVIDYKKSRFEDRVEDVDVVFDAVGEKTLDRSSWALLKPEGRLVTDSYLSRLAPLTPASALDFRVDLCSDQAR